VAAGLVKAAERLVKGTEGLVKLDARLAGSWKRLRRSGWTSGNQVELNEPKAGAQTEAMIMLRG